MEILFHPSNVTPEPPVALAPSSSLLRRPSNSSVAMALLTVLVVTVLSRCFYNLYLHPLRKLPGPKLAAMTWLPDFWYDVVKGGTYLFQVAEMHNKYGPIVRITPNEVHINDPDFFPIVYSSGSAKVDKDASTVVGFSQHGSLASIVDHDAHRVRRGYMSSRFSKRAINNLVPFITERLDIVCSRLDEALDKGGRVSLDRLFSALTADIIDAHYFGQHLDYVRHPDLKVPYRDAVVAIESSFHSARFLAGWLHMLNRLPWVVLRPIMRALARGPGRDLLDVQDRAHHNIQRVLGSKDPDDPARDSVLFSALSNMPPHEKNLKSLVDDGTLFGFAGTETTARSMAVGSFYLCQDENVLSKLRAELAAAKATSPNGPDLTLPELEGLPYLTGVVKEAVRLAFGPTTRLPRIHVNDALDYQGHIIPAGSAVSMSSFFLNLDPKIFPEPWKFNPDRWIDAAEHGFPLSNYLASFSRGTRMCIAVNLAYAELYLAFSRIPCLFDMELVDTTWRDVSIEKICIFGFPRVTKGRHEGEAEVKIKVTRRLGP